MNRAPGAPVAIPEVAFMKRTVLAVILGVLPPSAPVAGDIDVDFEVPTAHARLAVATGHVARHDGSGWVPGGWENHGGQWVYREGHWRRADAPPPAVVYHPAGPVNVVYTEVPPPAPMVEAQPVAPYPHAVWIPGHWRWY